MGFAAESLMTSDAAEEARWQGDSTLIWLVRLSVGALVKLAPASTHYLYKSKISFAMKDASNARLNAVALPPSLTKMDPFLGEQEIYGQPVQISLPLAREPGKPAKFTLVATYQGCNEKIGLCYSPIETPFEFKLP